MVAIHPLRLWLIEQGIRADAFAKRLGMTPAALSRWLNYRCNPSMASMMKVRDATAGAVQPTDFAPPQPPPN